MSLSIYMKGDYEEFHALRRQKNKAKQSQTKPISDDGCTQKSYFGGSSKGSAGPLFMLSSGIFGPAGRRRGPKGPLRKRSC